MVLSLNVTRPKLTLSTTVPVGVYLGNPVENAGAGKYEIRGYVDNLNPNRVIPDVTGCSYIAGGSVITAVANAFADVRLGDIVSGDDIAAESYVTAIANDYSSITINTATTNVSDVTGSGVVSISPKEIDATLFILELGVQVSNNNILLTPTIHEFDGTKAFDGADGDGEDEVTVADAIRSQAFSPFIINLDTYLTNARLDRTN